MKRCILSLACLAGASLLAAPAHAQALSLEAVNQAEFSDRGGKGPSPSIVKAQVLLDKAGFSPGVIDGRMGENVEKAIKAFEARNGLKADGKLDQATFEKLTAAGSDPVLVEYKITQDDVDGPFTKDIPEQMEALKDLKRLAYRGPKEALAEKFHMDQELLEALNPDAAFDKAGTTIRVANVAGERERGDVARIEVDKAEKVLRAFGKDGELIAFYPASIGSDEKPAPSGTFEVRAVAENPTYQYNPEYNFAGVKAKEPFKIAGGPNNPVGAVWIDLTAESYGIHGTPEPDKVSKTYSHGCIRLTNWDAKALAKMVEKGTKVEFKG